MYLQCMYVCMYVCTMYVCRHAYIYLCMYVCMLVLRTCVYVIIMCCIMYVCVFGLYKGNFMNHAKRYEHSVGAMESWMSTSHL